MMPDTVHNLRRSRVTVGGNGRRGAERMVTAKAREYLETLRANVWQGLGKTPREPTPEQRALEDSLVKAILRGRATLLSAEQVERLNTNALAELERQRNRPVSKYEDAWMLSQMEKLADDLEQAARRLVLQP
jgi:hypothetical protein